MPAEGGFKSGGISSGDQKVRRFEKNGNLQREQCIEKNTGLKAAGVWGTASGQKVAGKAGDASR